MWGEVDRTWDEFTHALPLQGEVDHTWDDFTHAVPLWGEVDRTWDEFTHAVPLQGDVERLNLARLCLDEDAAQEAAFRWTCASQPQKEVSRLGKREEG